MNTGKGNKRFTHNIQPITCTITNIMFIIQNRLSQDLMLLVWHQSIIRPSHQSQMLPNSNGQKPRVTTLWKQEALLLQRESAMCMTLTINSAKSQYI